MTMSLLLVVALAAAPLDDTSAEASAPRSNCTLRWSIAGVGSATEDLARVAELTGAAPVRPELFRRWSSTPDVAVCAEGRAPHPSRLPEVPLPATPTVEALPFTSRTYLETGYPDDRNDGALWRGRGISTEVTGGVRFRWKFFSAAVAPVVAWQQNRDYPHPAMTQSGYSPFANPFNDGQIDLPLRFGPDSFWTVDPGQSYARIDLYNVALGISTENQWWGPGIRNSLSMSNSAPGMPHVFLGTSTPQDIWIGWLEAQLQWGRLRESKWFDDDPKNDDRLFTSLTLGYEPRWIPGLFVGFTRVFLDVIPPGGLPFRDYFGRQFQSFGTQHNFQEHQQATIFARWVMPESGFELYGEWGRGDYSQDFRDFITQPEHDSGYMLGLQKVFAAGRHWIRLNAELTNTLQKPTALEIPERGTPIFYTHGAVRQGYTNDGQMLGAGIGPQANSQFLAIDYFHERGRVGAWFERVLRNGSYFWRNVAVWKGEDVEFIAGLRGLWSWSQFDLEASAAWARRYNLDLGDVHYLNPTYGPDVIAFKGMLSVTWWPGRTEIPRLPPPGATRHP